MTYERAHQERSPDHSKNKEKAAKKEEMQKSPPLKPLGSAGLINLLGRWNSSPQNKMTMEQQPHQPDPVEDQPDEHDDGDEREENDNAKSRKPNSPSSLSSIFPRAGDMMKLSGEEKK